QHGKLKYPEGTACAEVLIAGEKGGASARMVFVGFGIALLHKFLNAAGKLWTSEPSAPLYAVAEGGKKVGLKGAAVTGELTPAMPCVRYLIGPRIASMMLAGAVLSFFVIAPIIPHFGEGLDKPVSPARSTNEDPNKDKGLIRNMEPGHIKNS